MWLNRYKCWTQTLDRHTFIHRPFQGPIRFVADDLFFIYTSLPISLTKEFLSILHNKCISVEMLEPPRIAFAHSFVKITRQTNAIFSLQFLAIWLHSLRSVRLVWFFPSLSSFCLLLLYVIGHFLSFLCKFIYAVSCISQQIHKHTHFNCTSSRSGLFSRCVYHFGKCSSLHGHRSMSRAILRSKKKLLSFRSNDQHTWVIESCLLAKRGTNTRDRYGKLGHILHQSSTWWNAYASILLIICRSFPQTTQTTGYLPCDERISAHVSFLLSLSLFIFFSCQPFLYPQNKITAWDLPNASYELHHFDYLPFFCIRCLFIVCMLVVAFCIIFFSWIGIVATPIFLFTSALENVSGKFSWALNARWCCCCFTSLFS